MIELPHNWTARLHQRRFMNYMWNGGKRALLVWHRRAGKDSAALNFTAVETQRVVANYWHMFPTQKQARKAIWEGVNPHTGERFIHQAFPRELWASKDNTEMLIRLKNGSTWQLVGSDTFDGNVGTTPRGVVFSEWSLCDPRAWDFIRPILKENGGWAIFPYTPRGKNHGYDLYQMAKDNPDWFSELLTIDDTKREDGSPIFTQQDFENEIAEGMDPLLAKQEYYCSFDAGLMGAYYADQLKLAPIGDYAWNPAKPVHTFWDLGLRDANAIVFAQESMSGDAVHIIDYEEASNIPLYEWIRIVRSKPYNYGVHVAPHDIRRRDYKDGNSYIEFARDSGIDFEICPDLPLRQGIDATKAFLPRVRFNNSPEVLRLHDALSNYRRQYNSKLRVFMDRPLHDWASNGADAARYMSIAWPDEYGSVFGGRDIMVKPAIGRPRRIQLRT